MIAELPDCIFVGRRLQSPNSRILVLILDHTEAQVAGNRIEKQNADVDPFVADQVRGVAQHVVRERMVAIGWLSARHRSNPVRKRLPGGVLRGEEQFRHSIPAFKQPFRQPHHRIQVVIIPIGRNLLEN